MIQACSDPCLKALILESKTFQCNIKEKEMIPLSFSLSFFAGHFLPPCASMNSLGSAVWAVVSSVTALSVRSMGRIFGTTVPGPAHCNKHQCFILSFPEIYRGAAWHLGTVTTSVLVDWAGRNMLLARNWEKTPRRKVLTDPAGSLQQVKVRWPRFFHRLAILTLQLQMGETLGQRKEEEGKTSSTPRQPPLLLWRQQLLLPRLQLVCAGKGLTTTHGRWDSQATLTEIQGDSLKP